MHVYMQNADTCSRPDCQGGSLVVIYVSISCTTALCVGGCRWHQHVTSVAVLASVGHGSNAVVVMLTCLTMDGGFTNRCGLVGGRSCGCVLGL